MQGNITFFQDSRVKESYRLAVAKGDNTQSHAIRAANPDLARDFDLLDKTTTNQGYSA